MSDVPRPPEPVNADRTTAALYALFDAVMQAKVDVWSEPMRSALNEATAALRAQAEGWPHAVRIRVMDRPGRWAHLIVHGQYAGGVLVEVERYEDAAPMDALPPDPQVEDGGWRHCVHGRTPLGDWCRQCNPLRR